MTKQLNDEYRVRNPELKILYQRAKSLIANFESVKIIHIPRDRNVEADALASAELKNHEINKDKAD